MWIFAGASPPLQDSHHHAHRVDWFAIAQVGNRQHFITGMSRAGDPGLWLPSVHPAPYDDAIAAAHRAIPVCCNLPYGALVTAAGRADSGIGVRTWTVETRDWQFMNKSITLSCAFHNACPGHRSDVYAMAWVCAGLAALAHVDCRSMRTRDSHRLSRLESDRNGR